MRWATTGRDGGRTKTMAGMATSPQGPKKESAGEGLTELQWDWPGPLQLRRDVFFISWGSLAPFHPKNRFERRLWL